MKLVVLLYPTYEDTEYLEGGTSYINILRCLGVLVFAGLAYSMGKRKTLWDEKNMIMNGKTYYQRSLKTGGSGFISI